MRPLLDIYVCFLKYLFLLCVMHFYSHHSVFEEQKFVTIPIYVKMDEYNESSLSVFCGQ